MGQLPYQVYNSSGQLVLQAAERCRYTSRVELGLLDAGYTIRLHDRRITKTEVRRRCNHESM